MTIDAFLHLLHLLGVLHYLREPSNQVFCTVGRTLVRYHFHAYCIPDVVLDHLRRPS